MDLLVAKRSINLKGLPKEGAWFIRWIDHFAEHPASLSNPEIGVALERLPDDHWEGVTFAEAIARNEPSSEDEDRPMESRICWLHAGVITGLYLGAVIHKGAPVPFERLKAPIETFSVKLPEDLLVPPATDENFGLIHAFNKIGPLLRSDSDLALIPKKLYRTFLIPRLVTPVKVPGGVLILPSSVVIRAFISPVGVVIRDLVRKPPEFLLDGLLGPGTEAVSEETWRVALNPKIGERHAPLIANLHEAFKPYGGSAAKHLNDEARRKRFAGPLPFTKCTLQMVVHVHQIAPGHWLALDVASASWPYSSPTQIDVIRWVAEGDQPDDTQYRPGGRPGLATEGQIDAVQKEDAHEAGDLVMWETGGPEWTALPRQRVVREPYSREAERWVGLTDESPASEATMGGSGPYGVLNEISYDQRPEEPSKIERVPRFEEILTLFDELCVRDPDKKRGVISSWSVIAPKTVVYQVKAETRPLWRFQQDPDDPNPWVVLNPGSAVVRSRTAMICRLVVPDHGDATWFEIEGRRPNDVYRALIVGRILSEADIIRVLAAVSDENNVTNVDYDSVLPACPPPALWKHMRDKQTRQLSLESAWAWLVTAFG